jgi:hypothetical protein
VSRVRTTHEIALQKWLAAAVGTGIEAIYEDADGDRPDADYATLKVIAFPQAGEADRVTLDQTGPTDPTKCKGVIQRHYEGTCSVQTFGQDAADLIERILDTLDLPDFQLSTHADGLFLESHLGAVDLTGLGGIESVPRFSADVRFHWARRREYDVDVIENVTVTEV